MPGIDFDLLLRDGTVRATTRSVSETPRIGEKQT
jgi:hypothetical protein